MRNQAKDAIDMAAKRQRILEEGFRLFSKNTIAAVSMNNIADACGIGVATLYRYYKTKSALVMAIATWLWEGYVRESFALLDATEEALGSAEKRYEFFVDTFIDLYRNHKDMLRYNQLLNIYICSEKVPSEHLAAYSKMIGSLSERFQKNILKGQEDGTIRSDVSGQEIFSATLHLMLAATTRYAFGLVYRPEGGTEEEKELLVLKQMLLSEFTTKGRCNYLPLEDQIADQSNRSQHEIFCRNMAK